MRKGEYSYREKFPGFFKKAGAGYCPCFLLFYRQISLNFTFLNVMIIKLNQYVFDFF
jgi:hypothetical protein